MIASPESSSRWLRDPFSSSDGEDSARDPSEFLPMLYNADVLLAALAEDDQAVILLGSEEEPPIANTEFFEMFGIEPGDAFLGRDHLLSKVRLHISPPEDLDNLASLYSPDDALPTGFDLLRTRDGRMLQIRRRRLQAFGVQGSIWRIRDVTDSERAVVVTQEMAVINRLLAAVDHRDGETAEHTRRVGLFAHILAHNSGWSDENASMMEAAAPMHDIGKVGVPDAILCKAGPLVDDEYEQLKFHTIIGGKILRGPAGPVITLAREIALHHHERWDGTGYPFGLAGESIPESARIVSLIDVYDALTHARVYRPALPEDDALSLIKDGRESHFDPHLLDLFFTSLPEIRFMRTELEGQHPQKEL